jgi:uncharacterized membrane protein (UPF0127 family)
VLADTFFSRLRGLLGRGALDEDEGMLITPASSIHTCFMRFRIDVVFLEADLTVLGVRERLKPWRATAWRGARLVLELPAGAVDRRQLRPGDRLELCERGEDEARVVLVLEHEGDSTVVYGRGPISAAARTVSAMRDLDVGVSAVLLRDEEHTTA